MKRIVQLRRRRGLTQAQAAERVGVVYWTYVKTEEGVYVPRKGSPFAKKLVEFYNYGLGTLLKDVQAA